jgi:osmotically-inducible protein OsmY
MRIILMLVLAATLSLNLNGCVPVVAGGAAAGGLMAADRRTSGTYVEDEEIELKATDRINKALGDKIHVNVTSFNRNVLLTGEAIDEASKANAEEIAKAVREVRSVTNDLIIAGASSLSSRSNDAYITSKVKARMVSENLFPANYVKVVTENSVVYLMGMVTRKEAEDAVKIARETDGVEKVVTVFEYVVVE